VTDAAGTAPNPLPATESPPPPPPTTSVLDRALMRGLAWTGTVKWGSQLIAWVATLFVAHVLVPSDYGILAMSAVFMGLVTLLSEFGFGAAILVLRDLPDELVAQTNTLSLFFGAVAAGVACLTAAPLGRFFDAPALPQVIVVLSVGFVINGFRTVPQSLLQRELRFKLLACIDGVQSLASSCSMVVFALLGFRYWTLVLGGLVGAAIATVLVLMARRHSFAWPQLRALTRVTLFGWRIVVTRLSFYIYSSADLFIAGKTLTKTALGGYGFAVSLATMLPEKILALVSSITPSIFSSVQDQQANLRRYLLSVTEGLAFVVFPATLGLAAVSHEFVLVALGEKWRLMIAPMQVLAAYAGFRSIASLPGNLLNVIGEIRFSMWVQVIGALTLPFAFYIGSRWGPVGIASAWVVIHPLVNAPLFWRTFKRIDLSVRRYLDAISPALTGSAIMLVAVLVVRRAVPGSWPPAAILGVEVLAGFVAYASAVVALRRDRISVFYRALKLLRS
jgi:O-antigen/teichoic acid export membrane protein